MQISRRRFISQSISGTTIALSGLGASALVTNASAFISDPQLNHAKTADDYPVNVFSKMLHWLNYEEMAKFASEVGFDGIDLTVRPNGHVLPENVVQDLPKAINIIRKAGLDVTMITTAITHADDPATESILKTASSLGVKQYRMGWINYDSKLSIPDNLIVIEKQLTKLAQLNAKYKIIGAYQNHSGANFGSPMWDLHSILHKINSPWLGSQFDIYHATAEAANSWTLGLELLKPFIHSVDVKDFMWEIVNGKQVRHDVPLGHGKVDLKKFFGIIKAAKIVVPVSLHFEYDLGGAQTGASQITMSREKLFEFMRGDLESVRRIVA